MSDSDGPRVYWYGPVDKIGSNLAALPRVLFVTSNSLLVCQPSGGVTRTVLVDKLVEVSLAPPSVVRIVVAQEPDLVVSTQTPKDRSNLMDALMKSFHETCGEGSELPITQATHLQMATHATPQAGSSHSAQLQARTTPVRDNNSIDYSRAPSPGLVSSNLSVRNILSRLEDEASAHSGQHSTLSRKPPALSSSPVATSVQQGFVGDDGFSDHSIAALHKQIDSQNRIIDQLRREQQNNTTVEALRRELDQSKALIVDLQVALRSQENAFSEMVKANDSLKASETIRSTLEAQIQALRDENQSLRLEVGRRDQTEEEWRKRLASQEESHKNELHAVRTAFAKYDEQVTTYVDQLKKEHDSTLRELLQQKDTLLVQQGALQTRIDQLELEKRNIEVQKSVIAGTVWRPQQAAQFASESSDLNPNELRSALMAKLNRYTDYTRPTEQQKRVSEPPRRTPPPRALSPNSTRIRDRTIL